MKIKYTGLLLAILSTGIMSHAWASDETGPKIKETYEVDGVVRYAPAVRGETLYVNTDKQLYAFNVKSEQPSWVYDLNVEKTGMPIKFTSSPLVYPNNEVYIQTTLDDELAADVYAFKDEGSDYKELWNLTEKFIDPVTDKAVVGASMPFKGKNGDLYVIAAEHVPYKQMENTL